MKQKLMFCLIALLAMVQGAMASLPSSWMDDGIRDHFWGSNYSSSDELVIEDEADMGQFQYMLAEEKLTFEGKTVRLKNSLNMVDHLWHYVDEPASFMGTFDGDGFYIS